MNIQFSQILLIAALILFVIYIYRLRTDFLDRLVYLACAGVGIVLVIDPMVSTQIANLLGIGRGADLLFYLFIVANLFYAVATRSRIRRMEKQITTLVRQNALDHPIEGNKQK
jgi:small membrane protein